MNKAYLKKKWFKYCDTDKLVDDVMRLLNNYGHANTEHGVCTLLDTYFRNKEPLIKMFINSNHYAGNMRISLEKEFDRQIDKNEIYRFFEKFHSALGTNGLVKKQDNDGKEMLDYLATGKTVFDIDGLPKESNQEQILAKIRMFDYTYRTTRESQNKYYEFVGYVDYFSRMYYSTIPQDWRFDRINTDVPVLKKGTKTSRAFNAVCTHYGVDKLNPQTSVVEINGQPTEKTIYPYNKAFAEYSDLVSDLKRKMRFFISLNPLDYLTMSNGTGWVSCHNLSGGSYKGGCLSYMLDKTSMITFVVNNVEDTPIHEIPKLYRQMYHYENGLFIQNRLYPQGNDGATNLYNKFRDFIIEEFTEIMNVEGDWDVACGTRACTSHIHSEGTHYRDYTYNDSCSIFYPISKFENVNRHVMTIGHDGICVKCGGNYSVSSRLNHRYSNECEVMF